MSKDLEELREFYNHRLALNYGDDSSKETPEYWDLAAESFSKSAHSSKGRKTAEDFLNRFNWEKDEKVLDVACGPGTYAIPLAIRGCKVTGIDFSSEMLKQLRLQSEKENVVGISTIQNWWLEANFPTIFDTVLCLNSLGVITTDSKHTAHLDKCLSKLYSIAKKRLIVLIPHSDSILDEEMRKILKIDKIPLERLRIALIYLAMVDQGMLPSLEIIDGRDKRNFNYIEEACDFLLKRSGMLGIENTIKARFIDYLQSILQKNGDGTFCLNYNVKQAIFTVNK